MGYSSVWEGTQENGLIWGNSRGKFPKSSKESLSMARSPLSVYIDTSWLQEAFALDVSPDGVEKKQQQFQWKEKGSAIWEDTSARAPPAQPRPLRSGRCGQGGDGRHGAAAAACRLGAGTFPAKLWSLANDPRVLSVRWDSEARGLLVDRSLFERELLRPGGAQGPAPHAFRATQFSSFVRQLYRYGFRKGNINVAPESPREDPMNRAEAEEVSSGTESCGNSSPEPEEPGLHTVQVVSSCDLSNGESMDPTAPDPQGSPLWDITVLAAPRFPVGKQRETSHIR
ncbi:hypothetical protein DUI87_34855 [Hirundo rustica rustica]|uniref:HSF-type DNA-binding domain-containing protein n=1 Tax=Hirundo rustica rustica TaxID=333673 RepID=A0A3M0IJ26_HIRRU|nr:hypothetical protein DUI87_34855 [Hirundo rustica rustica]